MDNRVVLSGEEYHDYCKRFDIVWKYLNLCSYDVGVVADNVCKLRGYSRESGMPEMLKKTGFLYIDKDVFDVTKLEKLDRGDLGILTDSGNFLLEGRFIFPVRDMNTNILALIGWYPDEKKYITTPSRLFSKKAILFGMEQLKYSGIGKKYFLVEGIFDSLSVRNLGLNCVALMGISAGSNTRVLYSLFSKLVAIPDNDTQGRKVIENDLWKLPTGSSYLRWKEAIKDIDDMTKKYDMKGTLADILAERTTERVITI